MNEKTLILNNLSETMINININYPITNTQIPIKELWEKNEKQILVLNFLRRFGCPLCRLGSFELNEIVKKLNDKYNQSITIAAIGLAFLDYEDFIEGNYISGKVYIDETKQCYKLLGFGRKGFFSCWGLCDCSVFKKNSEAKKKGITGNFRGDGFQLGGTLIIDKLGNLLYSHKQASYGDYPREEEISNAIEGYFRM